MHFSESSNKKIMEIVLFALAMWIFFLTLQTIKKAENYKETASLINVKSKISSEEAEKMYRDNVDNYGENFVIWGEQRKISLYNKELNRYCEADHINAFGQVNILFPESDVTYVSIEDKTGCIIDENTAFQLFGNKNVVGNKVEYNGKSYTIRSVISQKNSLFITQSGEFENILDTVTMRVKAGETPGYTLQKMRTAFLEMGEEVDFSIFMDMIHIYLWFLGIIVILKLLKSIQKKEWQIWWKRGMYVGIFLVYLIFCIRFFKISVDNIPSKWSDYEYWRTFLETKKENIINFIKMPKRFLELEFLRFYGKIFFYGTIDVIILFSKNSTKHQ